MDNFICNNRRLIIFIISWIIGIGLILNFGNNLFCDKLEHVNGFQFTLIVLGITILLLPFIDKLKISASGIEFNYKIDKANTIITDKIDELKSQSDSSKKETIEEAEQESESKILTENDIYWKVARLRIEIEQALRVILNNRQIIKGLKPIDMKFLGLNKLFILYLIEYPDAKNMEESFKVFNQIANAVIHGQKMTDEQIDKGASLGINIMRYLKIKTILEKNENN
jgi:hypothetical protein